MGTKGSEPAMGDKGGASASPWASAGSPHGTRQDVGHGLKSLPDGPHLLSPEDQTPSSPQEKE